MGHMSMGEQPRGETRRLDPRPQLAQTRVSGRVEEELRGEHGARVRPLRRPGKPDLTGSDR